MHIAVVTMVFNEHVFLPIWLAHYGQSLGYHNLYVIDDGSDDGSTENPNIVNLIRRPRGVFDEDYRAKLISRFHYELLRHYDIVIFTDADELIVLDPAVGPSLSEYLGSKSFEFLNPIGFDVVHRSRREPAINLAKPLFAQRRFIRYSRNYSKPAVSAVRMEWRPGFHHCQSPPRDDRNLFLFHLRSMDAELARSRSRVLNRIVVSEASRAVGYARQFHMTEDEYVAHMMPSEAEFGRATDNDVELLRLGIDPGVGHNVVNVPDRFRRTILLSGKGREPPSPGASESLSRGIDPSTLQLAFAAADDDARMGGSQSSAARAADARFEGLT